jgi:DNA-binding MarR family transcriptional regulator
LTRDYLSLYFKCIYNKLRGVENIFRSTRKSSCHCINVRRAAVAVTDYYDQLLSPAGITLNQFSMLKNLRDIGISSVSRLANHIGLDRSTLVRGLKPLFKAGYIEDISQAGKRDNQVRLTPLGNQTVDVAIPFWEQAQEGVLKQIGEEGLETLTRLLSKIEAL